MKPFNWLINCLLLEKIISDINFDWCSAFHDSILIHGTAKMLRKNRELKYIKNSNLSTEKRIYEIRSTWPRFVSSNEMIGKVKAYVYVTEYTQNVRNNS